MAYTTIDKPTDYFNTKLYTGNGSTQSITGVGFQPDWVWCKSRSQADNHAIFDSVRGGQKQLRSNTADAELTRTNAISSFDSDGWSMGSQPEMNSNTITYASWNWLAGGTASSNTDGSITSSVSANTTAGFSIVSYTGNLTDGATVGHGLGVTPSCIIFRNRSDVQYWVVYHKDLGGANNHLRLDDTAAKRNDLNMFSSTAPTSSVFELGNKEQVNGNTNDIIAYCFAEKKGYSKFGSFTGNQNTDGTFIYLGFKPAWIMFKESTGSATGDNWFMFDNKRSTFNQTQKFLKANTTDAETDNSAGAIDMLSNGFKIRTSDTSLNDSGETYIYMAFAENPFVSSGGIPTTAR